MWEEPIPEQLGEPSAEVVYAATIRRRVAEISARQGLDLVHDHTCAGPLNSHAYAALGLPTVATVHGPVDAQMGGFYRALGDDVGLVAISHRQRALAPGLNWVATVHNGLHPQDWPFSAHKDNYALFLGRFHPHKGPHTALDAAHEVDIPLILAGKCAEPVEREFFAKEIEPRLCLTDEVIGVADAIVKRKLLSRARCLVFPVQWEEPFGMVMIEAMICGTPVVALRGGAVPEVIVPGVTGLICEDPSELPDAIRRASEIDPHACRNHVIENFSATRMAAGYAAAYRRVMARHRNRPVRATAPVYAPTNDRAAGPARNSARRPRDRADDRSLAAERRRARLGARRRWRRDHHRRHDLLHQPGRRGHRARQRAGLFYRDTRILSQWQLRIDGLAPQPLSVLDAQTTSARFVLRRPPMPGHADSTMLVLRDPRPSARACAM